MVLLLALLMLGVLYLISQNGRLADFVFWGNLCNILFFVAAVLILFGGLMRPLQKAFYHHAIEGNERYRRRIAVNPVLRWFWWLNTEGRDRDA